MSKITNGLLAYLRKLIDPSNGQAEAKLFVGLVAFFYMLIVGFVDLLSPLTPSEFVFFGMMGIVLGVFGLDSIRVNKSMTVKKDVASDIVNKEPSQETADDAKEVLNSDKP